MRIQPFQQPSLTTRPTMMRRFQAAILGLIALLLSLFLASTTLAAPAEKQWLLKGSLQAVETYELDFPTVSVDATGSGHATHLGWLTISYQAMVDVTTGSAMVSAHLVAANGDSLFAEGTGQGTETTPDVSQIVEHYRIMGGSGRFSAASGSFTVKRQVSLATGATFGTITGDIVVPERKSHLRGIATTADKVSLPATSKVAINRVDSVTLPMWWRS